MKEALKTRSGTVIYEGIEYNQFPTTTSVIKATEYYWACKLRDEGLLRLNIVDYYQSLESNELGDLYEGMGLLYLGTEPMHAGSSNEVFIWCAALPDTPHEILINLKNTYDSIVTVTNIKEFVARISESLRCLGFILIPHLGAISYNRGMSVLKGELNCQKHQYNMFQKDLLYKHQNEYRFAFINSSFKQINKKHIDLSIGECSDIIHVQKT